jgi:hypothetical protein
MMESDTVSAQNLPQRGKEGRVFGSGAHGNPQTVPQQRVRAIQVLDQNSLGQQSGMHYRPRQIADPEQDEIRGAWPLLNTRELPQRLA